MTSKVKLLRTPFLPGSPSKPTSPSKASLITPVSEGPPHLPGKQQRAGAECEGPSQHHLQPQPASTVLACLTSFLLPKARRDLYPPRHPRAYCPRLADLTNEGQNPLPAPGWPSGVLLPRGCAYPVGPWGLWAPADSGFGSKFLSHWREGRDGSVGGPALAPGTLHPCPRTSQGGQVLVLPPVRPPCLSHLSTPLRFT